MLFWEITSFFAASVLFSIKIFFRCKHKLYNCSNFFLSSDDKSLFSNNLFNDVNFDSNSANEVIFSGFSSGTKTCSLELDDVDVLLLSVLSSSVSWDKKSTIFSFSSSNLNNSVLSARNSFFPEISSKILITFNTNPLFEIKIFHLFFLFL